MRIVTLLPSATEIVRALGMGDSLVGISHSCDQLPGARRLPAVTSTRVPYQETSTVIDAFVREHLTGNTALYDLDLAALEAAEPDIIVSQTLCDVCAVSTGDVVSALESLPSRPVLIDLEPHTLDDVFADCSRVGKVLGKVDVAAALIEGLQRRRSTVAERTAAIAMESRPAVAFLEWLVPPFNGGHWNPELVSLAGGIDLLGNEGQPSTTMNWDQVYQADPDVIFVACCGFSKDRSLEDIGQLIHTEEWRRLRAVQRANVIVADGNMFSCPGPRLIDGLEMMAHALHPNVHPRLQEGFCVRPAGDEV